MVKEYMHTVSVLREAKESRPDFTVLVGFEDQLVPALLAVAEGAIRDLSNIAPKLHRRILSLMAITP
jgi:dihydrodipicolinate synthase/N-acetylneuraminate lyase